MMGRLKNLWKLSGGDITTDEEGKLVVEQKPEKRPAMILEDAPIDIFQTQESEL